MDQIAFQGIDWPADELFERVESGVQILDGRAVLRRVSLCDHFGVPTRFFVQGQVAHLYGQFEVLKPIESPIVAVTITDQNGQALHSKSSLQHGLPPSDDVQPGSLVGFHRAVQLSLQTGEMNVTVALLSMPMGAYRRYCDGLISHENLSEFITLHVDAQCVLSLQIGYDPNNQLTHYGVADLLGVYGMSTEVGAVAPSAPGADSVSEETGLAGATVEPEPARRSAGMSKSGVVLPTFFHVTHWKAGSQWIGKILKAIAPGRYVTPRLGNTHFLYEPMKPGFVYPTLYLSQRAFNTVPRPADSRVFVMIRDLRDTLVSGYFSVRYSHAIVGPDMWASRQLLEGMNEEEGLLLMLEGWLPGSAAIQWSWLEAGMETGQKFYRYEDLLDRDEELLVPLLKDECGFEIGEAELRQIIRDNRFAALTGGRQRGVESLASHERKGIAGDWKNHFTPRVKQAFKLRYGNLLIESGYESGYDW